MFLFNDAGFTQQVNNVGDLITRKKVKEMNSIHLKYVDDLSFTESVDMSSLSHVPRDLRTHVQGQNWPCFTNSQFKGLPAIIGDTKFCK